jgi:hypothetical protein
MQAVAESRAERLIFCASSRKRPGREGYGRAVGAGPLVIEPRMLAHEAPKLGAEKHIEHVRGRTTHHIRK